jgi:hypothetical protein
VNHRFAGRRVAWRCIASWRVDDGAIVQITDPSGARTHRVSKRRYRSFLAFYQRRAERHADIRFVQGSVYGLTDAECARVLPKMARAL